MRILFTSSAQPSRGSWLIRGEQLGRAVGGDVASDASDAAIARADLVVVAKVASPQLLDRITRRGVRWVFDVVDCWPQPQGNAWTAEQAVAWLRSHVAAMAPDGLVCATEAMSGDLAGIAPALTLYHHARPGQAINPIREKVQAVGYEGSERYLDGWRDALEAECRKRGWRFVVNPPALADLDIVVALRGGHWTGYAPSRWKSNVKLANAQGTGTPILCQPDSGYAENASGGETFIAKRSELPILLDGLCDAERRRGLSELMQQRAPRLDAVAADYRHWLETIR